MDKFNPTHLEKLTINYDGETPRARMLERDINFLGSKKKVKKILNNIKELIIDGLFNIDKVINK